MSEQVWFLSVVLNERFSVTSIMAETTEAAINEAERFLTDVAGYTPRDCVISTHTIAKDEGYSLVSECFVASLLKS